MKCDEVRVYYDSLARKRIQLRIKRGFDVLMSILLIMILAIPMIIIALAIKLDSRGPAFFQQKRVTAYGRYFNIHKFRTMYASRSGGCKLTAFDDARVTRIGSVLRRTRLDELPQLFNVIAGDMSFVGTRPEVPEFVAKYTNEMYATLLLPAGITSRTSIHFRDEELFFGKASGAERRRIYIEQILPEKMKENLKEVLHFSILSDLKTMIRTVSCFK